MQNKGLQSQVVAFHNTINRFGLPFGVEQTKTAMVFKRKEKNYAAIWWHQNGGLRALLAI